MNKKELQGPTEKESGFFAPNGTTLLPLGLAGPFGVLLEMYQYGPLYTDARSGLQSQPERAKYKRLPASCPFALTPCSKVCHQLLPDPDQTLF